MNQNFALLVKTARKRKNITQSVLAEAIGIDHSYISKVERGLIPPPTRTKVLSWIDTLGIVEAQERMQFLLAAGCLSYEDLAQAANAANIREMNEAQQVNQILDQVRQSQDREEASNSDALAALQEKIGAEGSSKVTELVQLLGKSNLDKDTANRVLDLALDAANTILAAIVPPTSKEIPGNKSRKAGK